MGHHVCLHTDTDCLHIHADQYMFLQKKYGKLLFGDDMCQFHDDIDEVHNGKIIRDIWIYPNMYIMEVIGKELDIYKRHR